MVVSLAPLDVLMADGMEIYIIAVNIVIIKSIQIRSAISFILPIVIYFVISYFSIFLKEIYIPLVVVKYPIESIAL